jgi:hypothetical protein
MDRALEIYQKRDVFKAVKDMSLRQFISFSRGDTPVAQEESAIQVRGNQVYIGNRLAVTLDEELDPKTSSYLERVIVEAGEALEAGEVLYTTRLYDREEKRRIARAAERIKKNNLFSQNMNQLLPWSTHILL